MGYVGVIGNQESLDLLVYAAKLIRKKRDDVFYMVIGDGTELDNIKNLVTEYKLDDIFEFTGFIPNDEMIKLLSHSDICVCPDKYNKMNDKSTMIKILEYMALAKPIVQFELTENKLSAQNSALYAKRNDPYDFADKIIYLIDNEELRKKMGKLGRERIEKELSWKKQR